MKILVIEESLESSPATPISESSITTRLNCSRLFGSYLKLSLLCTLFVLGIPVTWFDPILGCNPISVNMGRPTPNRSVAGYAVSRI
jgi:hypothetical protein